jgi:catechol 2,3-dioxygenase-like lactoylglutathione lyase family enzyme
MDLPINVDIPDLAAAIAFYTGAFGLTVTRLFGTDGAELDGWPVRLYLLQKLEGSAFGSGLPATLAREDEFSTAKTTTADRTDSIQAYASRCICQPKPGALAG